VAIIDLGELGSAASDGPDRRADPVGRSADRSAWRRRTVLRASLAAVLAGALTLLVAGDPLPRPLPGLSVPARLGSAVTVVPGWLLVVDPTVPGAVGQQLTAYRIPGAVPDDVGPVPAWRIRLPTGGFGTPMVLDGTLVLTAFRPETGPPRVRVLDLATGAFRWERTGYLEAVSAAGDLLIGVSDPETPPGTAEPGDGSASPEGSDPATLEARDPVSGAVRWSLSSPPGTRRHYRWSETDGRSRLLVVVLPSGRVEARDVATGALLAATTLPAPGVNPGWHGSVAGDLFITQSVGVATAYGLPGLDRRWSAPTVDGELAPSTCGPHLCSYSYDGGIRVWDAGTGRTRWTDRRWVSLYQAGEELVGSAAAGPGQPGPLAVLDPDTGRSLAELGIWDVLPADQPAGRLIGVRTARDRRTWVAEIDTAARQVRLLTVLRGVSGECRLAERWLYCRRVDASVGLWALPIRP